MVSVNLLPERCEESNTVNVDIPHDGTKRSFQKVKSNPRLEQKYKNFGSWYGEDAADGSTFNYVQDADGKIHGSLIDINNHSVMQFSVENGDPIVIITDSSDFKPEIDPPEDVEDEEDEEENKNNVKNSNFGERDLLSDITVESTTRVRHQPATSYLRKSNDSLSTKQNQDQEGTSRVLHDDSGTNLDVMVVWTNKAECKNYGLSEGCTLTDETKAAMEALINLAMEETNTAFELSGVQTQLFLAHSYRHSTFNETSVSDDIIALRHGLVPGIHQKREYYGADLVVMIVHDDQHCGSGYLGPQKDKMYSMTAWDCATGYFTFGHEIAHNLGSRHDRGTHNDCDNDEKYQFGYRDPQARFRTILAYNCVSDECDNNPGGGCTRIQRFSSPSIYWGEEDLPVGTPESDNVRRINKVRSKVAEYFPHGGTCSDSTLEFMYQNQFITCAGVSSQSLCVDEDLQAICPVTCGTCSKCVDPTMNIKYFNTSKDKWQTKGCDKIRNHPTVRCNFEGISDTCRVTCGTC